MMDKLKLKFCLSSDLETPEIEEAARRWFINAGAAALDTFASRLNLSSDEASLLNRARAYLETPQIFHALFEHRANKELATLAQNKIPQLFEAVDRAAFELKKESVDPAAAFLLQKRLERLRAEIEVWRDAIRSGNFEVWRILSNEKLPEYFERFPYLKDQYNPNNNGHFPARWFGIPWNPAAAKVNREPEEFRQIWLNPEEDIPFVLEALKRLEFIDENEVWRVGQYSNPLGPIVALINFPDRSFFGKLDRSVISTAFCNRFKIKQPKKGFKVQHGPFQNSKEKMERYLTKNS